VNDSDLVSPRSLPGFSVVDAMPGLCDAWGQASFAGPRAASDHVELDLELCRARGYRGSCGESLVSGGEGGSPLRILVGLGSKEDCTVSALRLGAATLARAALGCTAIAVDLRGTAITGLSSDRLSQAWVEGICLAQRSSFSPGSSHHDLPSKIEHVSLVVEPSNLAAARLGVERGRSIAVAIWFARDLIDAPASQCTPEWLAETVQARALGAQCTARVLSGPQLESERLGGLLGVGRGSAEPAYLLELSYTPDRAVERRGSDGHLPTVALVGKGITFDSGGLSLKAPERMELMKIDMSGAAAVIATLLSCRDLRVGVRVIGITPLTENMPGGRATKPGDVLMTRDGTTVEVLNTDAEGRLVLADGLALAVESEPDAVIDIATLTGGCITALGSEVAGLMGNDEALISTVAKASATVGEPTWHLPLPATYKRHLESTVADLKNIGKPGGEASPLIAGLFLSHFARSTAWAHLDMAGPSWSDVDVGEFQRGGTGFGVRTLTQLLSSMAGGEES